MKPLSRASAPAKIILFGEHFVVYNRPAVVMAIERRAYVTAKPRADNRIVVKSKEMEASGAFTPSGEYQPIEGGLEFEPKFKPIYIITKRILSLSGEETLGLEIEVNSSIPIAAGLGSSAAVAVASASAISSLLEMRLSRNEIFRLAFEAERFVHVNPSGIDPAVSTYGGILLYRRDDEGIRRLDVEAEIPIIVGDTGVKRVTGEMVSRVGDLLMRYPTVVERIMDAGENIVKLGVEALKGGDMKTLGELMNINHALLCALGISSDAIERLISAARRAGALGAKLTGAGGGGCIIVLPEKSNVQGVTEAIRSAGGEAFVTAKAFEGVRIEE